MFRLRSRERSLEATLRRIEHRVLEDVHLPPWARRVAWAATTVLTVTVLIMGSVGGGVPLTASALGVGAAISSVVTLRRRQFRWCVAATYLSGLTTVADVGAFWWARTGAASALLATSTAVAVVAAATLTAVWVSVAIAPVKDSHPDMRQPSKRKWGVRESGSTITWPPPCAGPRFPDRK